MLRRGEVVLSHPVDGIPPHGGHLINRVAVQIKHRITAQGPRHETLI